MVIAEKEAFTEEYQHKTAVKTKPHITVANFLAHEAMEETIIRYTHRICTQHQQFDVSLNNYSGFPMHTIYLRVQDKTSFKQLTKELKVVDDYVSLCSCPPVQLIKNPHLTIARNLPETIYLKAMMDYSQKTFHETFTVNELVLLRRSNQYDSCKKINVFHLKPSPNNLFN
jgi:2'-5' RNA ligase